LVYCWVHSHTGFESVTSTKKVSCSAFALMASELVTFTTKVSCITFASLVCVSVALTNKIEADSDISNFKCQIFINNKADSNFSQFLSSILQPNKMCGASHLAANDHKGLFDSESLSNNDFRLVVNFKLILHSEGEHTTKPNCLIDCNNLVYFGNNIGLVGPIELVELIGHVSHTNDFVGPSQLIVESKYSKISLHFCKDCRIFCEGEWRKRIIKKDGEAIINAMNRNNLPLLAFGRNFAFGLSMAFGHNLAFGLNLAFSLIMAFGLTMAFSRGGIDKSLRKNISSNINLKYESCRYVHAE
jgi:hypothetical protein